MAGFGYPGRVSGVPQAPGGDCNQGPRGETTPKRGLGADHGPRFEGPEAGGARACAPVLTLVLAVGPCDPAGARQVGEGGVDRGQRRPSPAQAVGMAAGDRIFAATYLLVSLPGLCGHWAPPCGGGVPYPHSARGFFRALSLGRSFDVRAYSKSHQQHACASTMLHQHQTKKHGVALVTVALVTDWPRWRVSPGALRGAAAAAGLLCPAATAL